MPKWMKPSEEIPAINVGDRIVMIVVERESARRPNVPRLVILEAKEYGWHSVDPVYGGYTPEDGVLWSLEKDVCGIAHAACPEAFE